ncbi:hypothetical protein A9Q87_07075 [Flavobacteriales bacterium 34_180_T64]|nr:hypothetical protein A9Q87_07075 [Flavobacteriales bacterium 34_180_T64]
MKKVGIIFNSGFIESEIPKLFLDHNFDVKVSTTDISKKEWFEHLMELNNADRLHICELDETVNTEVQKFSVGCDIIVHSNNFSEKDLDNYL